MSVEEKAPITMRSYAAAAKKGVLIPVEEPRGSGKEHKQRTLSKAVPSTIKADKMDKVHCSRKSISDVADGISSLTLQPPNQNVGNGSKSPAGSNTGGTSPGGSSNASNRPRTWAELFAKPSVPSTAESTTDTRTSERSCTSATTASAEPSSSTSVNELVISAPSQQLESSNKEVNNVSPTRGDGDQRSPVSISASTKDSAHTRKRRKNRTSRKCVDSCEVTPSGTSNVETPSMTEEDDKNKEGETDVAVQCGTSQSPGLSEEEEREEEKNNGGSGREQGYVRENRSRTFGGHHNSKQEIGGMVYNQRGNRNYQYQRNSRGPRQMPMNLGPPHPYMAPMHMFPGAIGGQFGMKPMPSMNMTLNQRIPMQAMGHNGGFLRGAYPPPVPQFPFNFPPGMPVGPPVLPLPSNFAQPPPQRYEPCVEQSGVSPSIMAYRSTSGLQTVYFTQAPIMNSPTVPGPLMRFSEPPQRSGMVLQTTRSLQGSIPYPPMVGMVATAAPSNTSGGNRFQAPPPPFYVQNPLMAQSMSPQQHHDLPPCAYQPLQPGQMLHPPPGVQFTIGGATNSEAPSPMKYQNSPSRNSNVSNGPPPPSQQQQQQQEQDSTPAAPVSAAAHPMDSWNCAVASMEREQKIREKIGLVINHRYRVQQKINVGSYGAIYVASDTSNPSGTQQVAVKFETDSASADDSHIQYELQVYEVCSGGNRTFQKGDIAIEGFPEVFWFGEQFNYKIMVMELLGPSLENLFSYCSNKFRRETIFSLGMQMLERVEHLHSRGFIHRDLKPENFLMGLGKKENTCYLIDFGLARRYRYRDGDKLEHVPYRKGKNLVGTAKYASINSHNGMELSRRDDLESLGYILFEFIHTDLVWKEPRNKQRFRTKQQSYNRMKSFKETIEWKTICPALAPWIKYCRELEFTQKPDYDFLRLVLQCYLEGREAPIMEKKENVAEPEVVDVEETTVDKTDEELTNDEGDADTGKSCDNVLSAEAISRMKNNRFEWIERRESNPKEQHTYQCLFRWTLPSGQQPILLPSDYKSSMSFGIGFGEGGFA